MANTILESKRYSGGTGTLTVAQSRSLASEVTQKVKDGATVTLSMQGISSMSADASRELFGAIMSNKEVANKVAIRGISPYMRQVISVGISRK
jgi:anti-anti-sigma regulatory factor